MSSTSAAMGASSAGAGHAQGRDPSTLETLTGPQGLPASQTSLVEGLNFVQLSLLDLDGKVVWSSDPASIGRTLSDRTFFEAAIAEGISSNLAKGRELVDLNSVRRRIDVVETLLPLRDSANGDVIGVLRIHRDVTDGVVVQVDAMKATVLKTTVSTMAALFVVLCVFIAVTGTSIRRANQRALAHGREWRQKLDEKNRALERANDAKDRFLSTVSHELKTPLANILAFADLMQRSSADNLTNVQVQRLDTIGRNGLRLSDLIDELLDLSQINGGSMTVQRSNFEVVPFLEDLVESFAPVLHNRRQTLSASLPERALWISADRTRVAQVISNLIDNASKYSPEDSAIELDAWSDEDRLHVAVRDRGIGIAREDQEEVFDAFFRADSEETRAQRGTGLGLMISKTLVEMHGGRIAIESEPGEGTTASFYVKGLLPERPDREDVNEWQLFGERMEPHSRLDNLEGNVSPPPAG